MAPVSASFVSPAAQMKPAPRSDAGGQRLRVGVEYQESDSSPMRVESFIWRNSSSVSNR